MDMGYLPPKDMDGTSGSIMGWRWGTPRVWTDKQTENIASRRTSYAGGNNSDIFQEKGSWTKQIDYSK